MSEGADPGEGLTWPAIDSADAILIPSAAMDGLTMDERAEVMSVARAAGLQRAREIRSSRREAEALPDFSQMAARTVKRRPQWDEAQDGSDAGEESQDG